MNENFEISRDIPVPEFTKKGRQPKYPFDSLEVGESFAVDTSKDIRSSVRTARLKYAHVAGQSKSGRNIYALERDFLAKRVEENGKTVWRVWRIK